MNADIAVLNEKLDALAARLEAQQQRLDQLEPSANGRGLQEVNHKLDLLLEGYEAQRRRQEELEELKRDLIPIANHMVKLSIDELAEIGSDFQLEDLLFLLKRLLRDTHLLVEMLDRLESTVELIDETKRLGRQAFNRMVVTLDRLERNGYFAFARGGLEILDRIVTEFNEEDVRLLGENIVTILMTVRNLTQPEIMALTNNALEAIRDDTPIEEATSPWALVRELGDPQVRKGLVRLLNLIKALAEQPTSKN